MPQRLCRNVQSIVFRALVLRRAGLLVGVIAAIVGLACTMLVPRAWAASDRVAIVLAAQEYQALRPAGDNLARGREIADALRAQGFDVALIVNPTNASARAALRDFAEKSASANLAIVVMQGHSIALRGNSFFIPVNAKITRSLDLLSQGIAVANVAQIASKAGSGAVLVLSTIGDIPSTLEGIEQRPGLSIPPPKNVVVAFSSSSKVPLSRVDVLTRQAAADLAEAVKERTFKLAALVNAASGGGVGLTFGTVPEVTLGLDAGQDKRRRPGEIAEGTGTTQPRKEADARLEAAEEKARQAEERAKRAELALRQEEQRRAAATAEPARAAAPAAPATAAAAGSTGAEAGAGAIDQDVDESDLSSLQVVEGLLGRAQRKEVQEQLSRLGLYQGPLDAVFGFESRQAIERFQEQNGAKRTGYLTPRQFQQLVQRVASTPTAAAASRDEALIAEAMRGAARWEHKGQSVFLAARGTDRKFIAARPGGSAVLLFDGERLGNRYRGTAYVQSDACGRLPFPAEGTFSADETTVTLAGEAPVTDANCKISGQRREIMEFSFRAPSSRR